MKSVMSALLLALCVASQLGDGFPIPGAPPQETQGCCSSESAGESECAQCACCVRGAPISTPTAIAEPLERPPVRIAMDTYAAPLSPPTGDILHVPKSS